MNFTESVHVVHKRLQELEPENASKIMGYILMHMQDNIDRHMIRLAFCPDSTMRSVIDCVKSVLPKIAHSNHFFDHIPTHKFGSFTGSSPLLENNVQFLNFGEHQCLLSRTSRRYPNLPEFPVKICYYFNKGFCKHGNNCRYFHGHIISERESFAHRFNPNNILNEEEHVISPGSLDKLEIEIIELLKSRRGDPISIASLPMTYYEKYGRTLQAEGYLTESQRHGKAGYSLTKLLARLKNTIHLIDRPHGQHSVILAEDASNFVEYTGQRNEYGTILDKARQLYLTFPPESSFTEQDVANYFSYNFGHVEDVRLPLHHQRMYGFVSFAYRDTVKTILAKGNPHFICGARVLVKPYREKLRFGKHRDINKPPQSMRYGSQFIDRDREMNIVPHRASESSRIMRNPFLNEPEQSVSKSLLTNYSYIGSSSYDYQLTSNAEHEERAEPLNYLLDYLNTDNNVMNTTTNYGDNDGRTHCESLDSQVLNLPESPEISMVT